MNRSMKIAHRVYYGRKAKTRKEAVTLIANEAGVSRNWANELYNRFDLIDAVSYVERT